MIRKGLKFISFAKLTLVMNFDRYMKINQGNGNQEIPIVLVSASNDYMRFNQICGNLFKEINLKISGNKNFEFKNSTRLKKIVKNFKF